MWTYLASFWHLLLRLQVIQKTLFKILIWELGLAETNHRRSVLGTRRWVFGVRSTGIQHSYNINLRCYHIHKYAGFTYTTVQKFMVSKIMFLKVAYYAHLVKNTVKTNNVKYYYSFK